MRVETSQENSDKWREDVDDRIFRSLAMLSRGGFRVQLQVEDRINISLHVKLQSSYETVGRSSGGRVKDDQRGAYRWPVGDEMAVPVS